MAESVTRHAQNPSCSPSPLPDIGRVLCDLNSSFNPLHRDFLLDFHVAGARDGFVCLSIVLPEGMTKVFVSMLESMTGFFRFIDIKSRAAESVARIHEPERVQSTLKAQAEFSESVCALYDTLICEGIPSTEAIKRTNLTLKAKGEVWATYATVTEVLRKAGRLRKPKSKKKGD